MDKALENFHEQCSNCSADPSIQKFFHIGIGYGKGAECFTVSKDSENNGYRVETSWKSKDLKAKFSNPVFKDGFLYGLSENLLVCLKPKQAS